MRAFAKKAGRRWNDAEIVESQYLGGEGNWGFLVREPSYRRGDELVGPGDPEAVMIEGGVMPEKLQDEAIYRWATLDARALAAWYAVDYYQSASMEVESAEILSPGNMDVVYRDRPTGHTVAVGIRKYKVETYRPLKD